MGLCKSTALCSQFLVRAKSPNRLGNDVESFSWALKISNLMYVSIRCYMTELAFKKVNYFYSANKKIFLDNRKCFLSYFPTSRVIYGAFGVDSMILTIVRYNFKNLWFLKHCSLTELGNLNSLKVPEFCVITGLTK